MKIKINNKTYNTEIMNTETQKKDGMKDRTSLDGCMLFNMGKGVHKFWMKGCLIPLDIVFVNNNKISVIHKNCPVPDRHQMNPKSYSGIGNVVLEFMSGESDNFKIGDRVFYV